MRAAGAVDLARVGAHRGDEHAVAQRFVGRQILAAEVKPLRAPAAHQRATYRCLHGRILRRGSDRTKAEKGVEEAAWGSRSAPPNSRRSTRSARGRASASGRAAAALSVSATRNAITSEPARPTPATVRLAAARLAASTSTPAEQRRETDAEVADQPPEPEELPLPAACAREIRADDHHDARADAVREPEQHGRRDQRVEAARERQHREPAAYSSMLGTALHLRPQRSASTPDG